MCIAPVHKRATKCTQRVDSILCSSLNSNNLMTCILINHPCTNTRSSLKVTQNLLGGTRQTTLLLDSYYYLRMGAQFVNCFKRGAVFDKFEKPWYKLSRPPLLWGGGMSAFVTSTYFTFWQILVNVTRHLCLTKFLIL